MAFVIGLGAMAMDVVCFSIGIALDDKYLDISIHTIIFHLQ